MPKSDISDMDSETLVARLRERLAATGKSPVPLAGKIGRGRDFLTDVLNGKKKSIPNDILTPLARELDCDERYFTDELFIQPGRARRPATPAQLDEQAKAAERSGMYLKAWREFVNLSLQELAAETGLTPGTISDLENGLAQGTDDQVATLARALNTTGGALRGQNPFETERQIARLASISEGLDQRDQQALIDMAEALRRRQAG